MIISRSPGFVPIPSESYPGGSSLGNIPHVSSSSASAGVHPRRRRQAILLVALAVVLSVLGVPAVGVSSAGHSAGDTIAVVDTNATFTILAELSKGARTLTFQFGQSGDVPLMGDWNCNGEDTPGTYRVSTGGVYLRNSNSGGEPDRVFLFGNPGDRPLVGDFDGDGCDTLSVYRSHRATAYLKNLLDVGFAEFEFLFGNPGDSAFAGDFDGDGVDSVGLHRDSVGRVYLAKTATGTAPTQVGFGNPGDVLISGDWDGDGIDTPGAYRPATGVFYYKNTNRTGPADGSLFVGRNVTVIPVSGIDSRAFQGPAFSPGPEPTTTTTTQPPAPAPTPIQPPGEPSPPAGGGGGGTVPPPGFTPPPDRTRVGPITVSGESNVVIENVHVVNPGGTCITVTNASSVVIRNATIGPCGGEAVYLSDVDGASVSGNYITDTDNGVLVHRSNSVAVDGNAFVNAGRNFVQFDKVNGSGSSISGNRGQNELGRSNAEDFISLYQSNGTSSSPIRIIGNHLRDGGPSGSGSGIMLGDAGGSYQYVADNVLVNPGQVGIGVASGTNITVIDNRVYSDGQPWSNVGIYVWNQYGSACGNVEVAGNQVNWTAAGGYSNPWWSGGGCSAVSIVDNDWEAAIGPNAF